ncbi:FitA-like ribbon-helix-helix domain-containing protein [Flexivirga oryzae]|uniref:FitA-like ribbon-helix-helix domain-containing protein n=1 Tax=Flexivirga oryzae TaxID=1794944 RepID=UPI003CCCF6B2
MPNIQVKNVPEETWLTLRRRASESGRSLQEYLRRRLIEDASTPTMDEVLDRIGSHSGGELGPDDAVAELRASRAGR